MLPTAEITQIFEYSLAHACSRHNIELHAFVAMSNHYHLVVTDPDGKLPAFQRDLNSLIARSVNRVLERDEAFWDRKSYNAVDILEPNAVLAKMSYTMLNPVRARLVGRAVDWQGATSVGMGFGRGRTIQRPHRFFRKDRDMPDEVTLTLTPPPGADAVEIRSVLAGAIAQGEYESKANGPPAGMRRVLSRPYNSRPQTREPRGQLRPRFAARCADALKKALAEYRCWLDEYRTALTQFREGERDVEFPAGTYRMCQQLDCRQSVV